MLLIHTLYYRLADMKCFLETRIFIKSLKHDCLFYCINCVSTSLYMRFIAAPTSWNRRNESVWFNWTFGFIFY